MNSLQRFYLLGIGLAGSVASSGCGGVGSDASVAALSEPLLITNCTGAAISAAVTAGGVVTLSCGTLPVTIQVPSTTVAHDTQLSAARPGLITFVHVGTLFDVTSGASFGVSGISFDGMGQRITALRADSATAQSVILSNAVVSRYAGLAIQVGNHSSLNVSSTTFRNNGGLGFASPIYSEGGDVTVSNSSFVANHSFGSGGAITSLGGGVLNVSGCAFVSNNASAGGAIYSSVFSPPAVVTNSTFASNVGSAAGGAVFSFAAATIVNCTFVDNSSPLGTIGGPAQVFGSIIVDDTPSSAKCSLSGSSNLQWPPATPLCGFGFRFADPRLADLANNGGATSTFALLPGSAAIDSSTVPCPAADQRGVLRPRDGDGDSLARCDIGAYER